MGDMSSIISGVGTASTWFFGLFKDMIDMIVANNLLLWSVLLALYAVLSALVSRLSASSVSRADADNRPLSGALCARCGLLLKIT